MSPSAAWGDDRSRSSWILWLFSLCVQNKKLHRFGKVNAVLKCGDVYFFVCVCELKIKLFDISKIKAWCFYVRIRIFVK